MTNSLQFLSELLFIFMWRQVTLGWCHCSGQCWRLGWSSPGVSSPDHR